MMSIRLVSDDNTVFWFTGFKWNWLIEFIGKHGWEGRRVQLLPNHWKGVPFNKEFEQIGGAKMDAAEANRFADAITRGIATPDARKFLLARIARNTTTEPDQFATQILNDWSEFTKFARKGGFRVDATD